MCQMSLEARNQEVLSLGENLTSARSHVDHLECSVQQAREAQAISNRRVEELAARLAAEQQERRNLATSLLKVRNAHTLRWAEQRRQYEERIRGWSAT